MCESKGCRCGESVMPAARRRPASRFGLGPASSSESRQADLFFFELVGRPPRRRPALPSRVAAETATARERAEDALEDDDARECGDVPECTAIGEWDDLAETFTPENLSKDMAGLEFVLAADGDVKTAGGSARHAAGTVVTVVTWDNAKPEIEGKIGGATVTVAKELLTPKVAMYKGTVTTAKGQREVAIPLYVSDARVLRAAVVKGKAAGADQTANYKQLNKHLIIETMLNRLDRYIGAWTTSYDALIGEPNGWVPLAPGWVKSMMVHESTAGTSGKYLEERAGDPRFTRFNVLQAIDSWGPQQFLVMKEIEPDFLKKKGLEKVMDDQLALEKEWKQLDARKTRSAAENERLKYLDELRFHYPAARKSPTWNTFYFRYPDVEMKPRASGAAAPRATPPATTGTTTSGTGTGGGGAAPAVNKYWDAVVEFLEGGTPKRKYDYSFWIRTGVRWLFEKRKGVSTWSDAVRAYNGTGGRAELYRAIVITRARAAAGAAGIKEEIWGGYDCDPKVKTKDGTFALCPFERTANPCEPRC